MTKLSKIYRPSVWWCQILHSCW